jgi:hypothetical protein
MRPLILFLLLTLPLATASCKRSDDSGNQNSANASASGANGVTSSTPPFATKEPERYQAARIVTSDGEATSSRTLIARDRDRRREDYESPAGERVSYLQLPEGIYVLLPAKKLYAELKPGTGGGAEGRAASVPPDFSPEKLLNEARPESRYERLGEETVNGRATVKYRVTVMGKTGAGRETTTESLVWVDESLGMPVKTETTSTGGTTPGARITMELRDIKETVDAGLLELPPDYRKVEPAELFAQAQPSGHPGRGRNQEGRDAD